MLKLIGSLFLLISGTWAFAGASTEALPDDTSSAAQHSDRGEARAEGQAEEVVAAPLPDSDLGQCKQERDALKSENEDLKNRVLTGDMRNRREKYEPGWYEKDGRWIMFWKKSSDENPVAGKVYMGWTGKQWAFMALNEGGGQLQALNENSYVKGSELGRVGEAAQKFFKLKYAVSDPDERRRSKNTSGMWEVFTPDSPTDICEYKFVSPRQDQSQRVVESERAPQGERGFRTQPSSKGFRSTGRLRIPCRT